ncbi:MAG: hypothetical protein H6553_07690 [Chitinophagales bacterium]|nr:hypothetical protein [Chitinophagales bacterium]
MVFHHFHKIATTWIVSNFKKEYFDECIKVEHYKDLIKQGVKINFENYCNCILDNLFSKLSDKEILVVTNNSGFLDLIQSNQEYTEILSNCAENSVVL